MANDAKYGEPTAGGGGGFASRTVMGMPMWVWIVGVGAVVIFVYYRRKGGGALLGGASSTTDTGLTGPTSTDGTGAVSFDPSTGLPIDPSTGLPYLNMASSQGSQSSIEGWVASAEAAGKSLGLSPSAVNQALYDYTQGNALSAGEAGIIDKLLGKIGYPPDLLPFFGPIPNPKPPVAKPPHKRPTKPPTGGGPIPVPKKLPGGGFTTFPPRPVTHPKPRTQTQLLPTPQAASFVREVLAGKAPLPKGLSTPAGYKINPKTRILTKA